MVQQKHWNHITKKLAEEVETEDQPRLSYTTMARNIAANKPGMTGEIKNFCLDESECLRKRLMTYLGSCERKSRCDVPSCCSSESTSTALTELTKQHLSVELMATQPIWTVSDEQGSKIGSILKQYRIHQGTRERSGSINLANGFTHSLINSVVKNCEYINSVDHVLLALNIWDVSHAHTIVKVICNVCSQ